MPAFEHRLRIRFNETDPAGIVFFANVLVYCHRAYEELLRAGGTPLEELIANGRQMLPLRHAEADFRAPLRLGQEITVRVTVARLGTTSFQLAYSLLDAQGELLATAATVHVAVDLATRRPAPVDAELRALLARHAA